MRYYGVGVFCRQNNYVKNCEADSLEDIGYAPDSQSIPGDIGAAASDSESVRDSDTGSDSWSIPEDIEAAVSDPESVRDFDAGSDSQSIPDDIEVAASDSESVRDFGGTGSDSQNIPDDTESAASDSESVIHGMDVSDNDSIQYTETDSNINDNNCQRARICTKHNEEKFKPKNLVPSLILIMQSNDTQFSCDESVLDVCIDDNVQENRKMYNLWGEMNVNDIPLDIKY